MEQIKITDKLTLRQEALRMALQTVYGVNVSENLKDLVIKRAEDIAEYIQGSAELPERDNAMEKYLHEMKDVLFNQHNPWISADSEMRPAYNMDVLVMLSGRKEPMLGKYNETGWIVPNAVSNDELVAWMPIPPFTQPTL